MPEDITSKILDQTTESIQKLYDLSTRVDERVKSIQINQKELELAIESLKKEHSEILQQVAVLKSKDVIFTEHQNEFKKELNSIEKRLFELESSNGQSKDRWNKIFTFVIQIIWVVLAAWLLMKLGLQSPP